MGATAEERASPWVGGEGVGGPSECLWRKHLRIIQPMGHKGGSIYLLTIPHGLRFALNEVLTPDISSRPCCSLLRSDKVR